MEKIVISELSDLVRIDKYMAENTDLSRETVKKMLLKGDILVNSEIVKPKYGLQVGDVVEIVNAYEKPEITLIAQDLPIDIVHEDDDVIVVNKASGMVVHPAVGNPDGTLVNALLYHFKELSGTDKIRPGIVHRIDKNTSGLLMVAKNDKAHEFLASQLKAKTSKRKYIALVHGLIMEDVAEIIAPIGRDVTNRKLMTVTSKNSKDAKTIVTVLERFTNYTLVECELTTGRTHQIRVHMKYIKHPVVGDPEYGPRKSIDAIGQALHAQTLGFVHPTTKEEMFFEMDPPKEFNDALEQVRKLDAALVASELDA